MGAAARPWSQGRLLPLWVQLHRCLLSFQNSLPQRPLKNLSSHPDALLTTPEGRRDVRWGILLEEELDVLYDMEDLMFQPEIPSPVPKADSFCGLD